MEPLILQNLPEHLHLRLKEQAARNNRCVSSEVLIILSENLPGIDVDKLPPPFKLNPPLTNELLDSIKREGLE